MTTRLLATAAPYALVCLVLAASCASPVDVGPPNIEGTITEVRFDHPLAPLMILVEESPPADPTCLPGRWFGVDSRTAISIITSTGSELPRDSDELRVGVRVRVWQDGDTDAVCQAVGRAGRVIVLE